MSVNRFAIRDAGEASFFRLDASDKNAIVTLKTLKTSGVSTSGETSYARGGFGNAKLVGFSSNRESKIVLEDAIFDKEAIAMLTGNKMTIGAKVVDVNEKIKVTSKKASISYTPSDGKIISVYKIEADGTNGELYTLGTPATKEKEYSISGKELTFHADVTDNTMFRVYYQGTTDANAATMKVTTDAFGGSFRVVLDVLVRDEYTKKDFAGQLRIPNAKFEDEFELSLSVDGDPATLNLPLEILKDPLSTNMWELVIYDDTKLATT